MSRMWCVGAREAPAGSPLEAGITLQDGAVRLPPLLRSFTAAARRSPSAGQVQTLRSGVPAPHPSWPPGSPPSSALDAELQLRQAPAARRKPGPAGSRGLGALTA